jgi:hypothetical protein
MHCYNSTHKKISKDIRFEASDERCDSRRGSKRGRDYRLLSLYNFPIFVDFVLVL